MCSLCAKATPSLLTDNAFPTHRVHSNWFLHARSPLILVNPDSEVNVSLKLFQPGNDPFTPTTKFPKHSA